MVGFTPAVGAITLVGVCCDRITCSPSKGMGASPIPSVAALTAPETCRVPVRSPKTMALRSRTPAPVTSGDREVAPLAPSPLRSDRERPVVSVAGALSMMVTTESPPGCARLWLAASTLPSTP